MNEAVNATLSRTLLTSGTTLISVAILAFLGGSALRDFGIIIFIGHRRRHLLLDLHRLACGAVVEQSQRRKHP
jgi:hypothetical protein